MLFHISEDSGIGRFDPRESPLTDCPVVWAINRERLCNYLVPRDCPRVTFYATEETSRKDIDRFLGSSRSVVAIEHRWFDRLRTTRLYCYELPDNTFELVDDVAGYHVSRVSVVPLNVRMIEDPLTELTRHGAELRILPSLHNLRGQIIGSTLRYSIIRMRNAREDARE